MTRYKATATSLIALTLLLTTACDEESSTSLFSPPEWKMVLHFEGAQLEFPLEVLNVYLVEDHSYPEIFEMIGPGVNLVGQFPLEVHVDYGEDWNQLIGVPITISPVHDFRGEMITSTITLANETTLKVVEGSFISESVTGKYAGMKGDMTLTGTINITVQTPTSGSQVLKGTFSVHAVSWG